MLISWKKREEDLMQVDDSDNDNRNDKDDEDNQDIEDDEEGKDNDNKDDEKDEDNNMEGVCFQSEDQSSSQIQYTVRIPREY